MKSGTKNIDDLHPITSAIASYGVYSDIKLQPEDDDDFIYRNNAYNSVVVNASGDSSVVRSSQIQNIPPIEIDACGWCFNSQTIIPTRESCLISRCRPIMLLVLVFLIVILILVSAMLLYYSYLSHAPWQHYIEEPCEKTFCAWGAHCVKESDGRAVCQCPTQCNLKVDPVCGTDGKTYINNCELRVASCKARLDTKIKYVGDCDQSDPCRNKNCGFGAQCVISSDGRNATCECSNSCPTYGDHTASHPVCGSDGIDYANLCELQKAACNFNSNISVIFIGRCDPCATVECAEPEVCQLDEHRNPVCRCGETCPLEFTPVCASDGKTYSNECNLRQQACRTQKSLNIIYHGKCSSGINPCTSVRCTLGEECVINKFGIAHCQCPQHCEPTVRPVCSKDGRTFPSECEMFRTACNSRTVIELDYMGVCGKRSLCSDKRCQYGAVCVEKSGAAHCECPICSAEFEPVCGSDGISYGNECKLKQEACKYHRDIKVQHDGPCTTVTSPPTQTTSNAEEEFVSSSELGQLDFAIVKQEACRDIHCDFEATCELGEDQFPRCNCQFDCSSVEMSPETTPVCASDLQLYSSLCAMKKEACQRQEDLRLRPLDLCQGMEVKPCNGEKPLTDPVTGKELDCGNGPSRQDCPSGSYCHQTTRFSRCCRKNQTQIEQRKCEDSWYGCCSDGKEVAQGPNNEGCPSSCGCNKLGSFGDTCDPETQQCRCRPGVGGLKCDRCEPGYWGLPKISSGHNGCVPCGCSTFGSVRNDCEQMTGRCVCKSGVQGQKCTICTSLDKVLGPNGCVTGDISTEPPTTCKELTCYFGALCVERSGLAICECHSDCLEDNNIQVVCGSDGKTYPSACKLRQVACRLQKDIVVQAFGSCKENVVFPGTDWPIHHYTPLHFTQTDDSNSPLSKSTRHLILDHRYYYDRFDNTVKNVQGVPLFITPSNKSDMDVSDMVANNIYHNHGRSFAPAYRPTPATLHVVTALLGDLCTKDSDCKIDSSHCNMGACTCLLGYEKSSDRKECIANGNSTNEFKACSSFPCHYTSTCIDLPGAAFSCICNPDLTGALCQTEVSTKKYEVPAFHGRSYIKLKSLKAYHKLSIEVEFKSFTVTGVILYSQQKPNGLGDFVSIALINRFVEFKYNLGNGPITIRSSRKIHLGQFHKIIVKRYHKDGILKIDAAEEVAGQAKGPLKALDLLDDTYIGHVVTNYSRVYKNIGTTESFKGCLRKLKIGRKTILLHMNEDNLVLETKGIYDCSQNMCAGSPCLNNGICIDDNSSLFSCHCKLNYYGEFCEKYSQPCVPNPCQNGATCSITKSGSQVCSCPQGYIGVYCNNEEKENRVFVPDFHGSSYMRLSTLEDVSEKLSIEVSFLSRSLNGLIFYNGQTKNGRGDFISLNIVHGYLQLRFNLGSGIANITSREKIIIGRWHWIRVEREGRKGTLQIDNSSIVRGFSGMPFKELNLELPFYIGSLSSWQSLHRLSGISKGFHGAIQKLIVNGNPVLFTKKLPECSSEDLSCSSGVTAYDGLPCPTSGNPCLNNGICIPDLNEFTCKCPSAFRGKYCDEIDNGVD